MGDLLNLITGLLDIGSIAVDLTEDKSTILELNKSFSEEFIEKHKLKSKKENEVISIIKDNQTELFNYGITTQEAYWLIFLGSFKSEQEIQEMESKESGDFLKEYKKFKAMISDLTES